jgi:hypothetical protein
VRYPNIKKKKYYLVKSMKCDLADGPHNFLSFPHIGLSKPNSNSILIMRGIRILILDKFWIKLPQAEGIYKENNKYI